MNLRAILIGLAFALMWSSAFSAARTIVADAPPLGSLAFRFLLSGTIGVVLARMLGQSWHLTREQWRGTIIFGLCQNALYLGLNFIAMQKVGASVAAIIASVMPLMVAFAGWAFYRERLQPIAVAGLFAGSFGVALIMGARINAGVDIPSVILCFIAVIALTVATLAVRGASGGGNLLMVVGLQMFVGAGILAVASFFLETHEVNFSWKLVWVFAYITLVPGLLATWVWFELVRQIGAVKAATFHFLNPFLGVVIAAILLGEEMGALDVIGIVVIMAGILAVQLSKQSIR